MSATTERTVAPVDLSPAAQAKAMERAMGFSPGQTVNVDTFAYRGTGLVSRRTHWDSHIVWLDHRGVCVAVLLQSGNVWLYPVGHVSHAEAA